MYGSSVSSHVNMVKDAFLGIAGAGAKVLIEPENVGTSLERYAVRALFAVRSKRGLLELSALLPQSALKPPQEVAAAILSQLRECAELEPAPHLAYPAT